MLLLTRRVGEAIVFTMGDSRVVLRVTQLSRSYVRVGIDAPLDVLILRDELEGDNTGASKDALST